MYYRVQEASHKQLIIVLRAYMFRFTDERKEQFESIIANLDEDACKHMRTMFHDETVDLLDKQRLIVIMSNTISKIFDKNEVSP